MLARTLSPLCCRLHTTSSIMKSFILTTSALAGLASAGHVSTESDWDIERHQEECDAGTVVGCQVENHWNHDLPEQGSPGGWMPCDATCGEGHSVRTRNIRPGMQACNGGTCPPLMQRKVCMGKV